MVLSSGSRPEGTERSTRWLAWFAAAPGIAALVGVGATLATIQHAGRQLTLAEKGHYTTRFNEATNNLGTGKKDVAIGAIYAFDRIMHDSGRDQPGIIAVLTAYARENSPVPMTGTFAKLSGRIPELRHDISAVVRVLAARPRGKDARQEVDLNYTDLHNLRLTAYNVDDIKGGAKPEFLHLGPVNLNSTDLRFARIVKVDLDRSSLSSANLTCLLFTETTLTESDLRGATLDLANLLAVKIGDESDPDKGVSMSDARMRGATLTDVDLSHANLEDTELCDTTFTNVNLTGANLRGAKLKGAKFVNSAGAPPPNSLPCHDWPLPAPITPDGTVVDTQPFTERSRHAHCKYPVDMQ